MKKSLLFFFSLFIISVTCVAYALPGCSSQAEEEKINYGYDFSSPEQKLILPDTLREISGLTILDSSTFACVQDENGILFLYDSKNNRVKQEIRFAADGDYEGICRVGAALYVLRSDGELFHISNYASAAPEVETFTTGIPADNNEGLCYDSLNNRLLVACKGKIGKGKEFKDRRVIYAFDLATKKLGDEPVFDFDVNEVIAFAEQHKIDLPVKEKKNGEVAVLKFRPSAIAIHPLTNELYLLSAVDHALFVFNTSGVIQHMEMLDETMFNKAEGISFYPNGDLLITNEAQDKKPTLLKFTYMP